ncbi:MAG: 4Fe-4S dicluster domain-containing protein [Kiritimatiellae bacterium]|nr:4Fe-4S dicluster domain-containing protein [Kiritimatiellia bacterium]
MKTDHMVLTREEILGSLDLLLPTMRILAPVLRDGVSGFEWIESVEEVRFITGGIPNIPPKKGLLPRTEVLFYFARTGREDSLASPPPPMPQLIFGLHPCDIRAVRILDTVFSAPPQPDGLYLTRREATTLIGLGTSPREVPPHAFFEDLGIGCLDNRDCDLFLVPLPENRFVLEVLSDKGAKLARQFKCGRTASAEEIRSVADLRQQAAGGVRCHFAGAEFQKRLEKQFDIPLWQELGEKCLSCGVCAFLCPTCHCFDIQDIAQADKGCRVRLWDTCQFELFTMHASGHNPRPEQKQRARQRIFHKFDYGERNFGLPFCVGCGRCVAKCPMHNDLRQVLRRIEQSDTSRPEE